jgi:hypothetical protein
MRGVAIDARGDAGMADMARKVGRVRPFDEKVSVESYDEIAQALKRAVRRQKKARGAKARGNSGMINRIWLAFLRMTDDDQARFLAWGDAPLEQVASRPADYDVDEYGLGLDRNEDSVLAVGVGGEGRGPGQGAGKGEGGASVRPPKRRRKPKGLEQAPAAARPDHGPVGI